MITVATSKQIECWYCKNHFEAEEDMYRKVENVCIIPPSASRRIEVRVSKIMKFVPCPRCGMSCDNQEVSQRLF